MPVTRTGDRVPRSPTLLPEDAGNGSGSYGFCTTSSGWTGLVMFITNA